VKHRAVLFVIAASVVFTLPAMARPRDDAMSGAFRCAAIGDLRSWLDCFYGAAQPVRAALAMPPAPKTQVELVAKPPTGSVPPDDVALRDAAMSEAFHCNSAADERQWLACYYNAVGGVRAKLGLASASPPPRPVAAAPAFGLAPRPRIAIPDSAGHIAARMQSYSFDGDGMFTVTLDNGQVWRQITGDTDYAHWKKPAGAYQVRISHGALGSYNLQVRNSPGVFKVRRTGS
jgi:hypothetical protein